MAMYDETGVPCCDVPIVDHSYDGPPMPPGRRTFTNWFFTAWVEPKYDERVRFARHQQEVGETALRESEATGKPPRVHWQGIMVAYRPTTWRAAMDSMGLGTMTCRVFVARSLEACKRYVFKDRSSVPGTRYEHGSLSSGKTDREKKDLTQTRVGRKMVIDALSSNPAADFGPMMAGVFGSFIDRARSAVIASAVPAWRDMRVDVYYGPPEVGKDYTIDQLTKGLDVYTLSLPSSPGSEIFFNRYAGERVLVIRDYDGAIPFRHFLRLLDGYPLPIPTKGSSSHALWTHVLISTNIHPEKWYNWELPAIGMVGQQALRRRITNLVTMQAPVHSFPKKVTREIVVAVDGLDVQANGLALNLVPFTRSAVELPEELMVGKPKKPAYPKFAPDLVQDDISVADFADDVPDPAPADFADEVPVDLTPDGQIPDASPDHPRQSGSVVLEREVDGVTTSKVVEMS